MGALALIGGGALVVWLLARRHTPRRRKKCPFVILPGSTPEAHTYVRERADGGYDVMDRAAWEAAALHWEVQHKRDEEKA